MQEALPVPSDVSLSAVCQPHTLDQIHAFHACLHVQILICIRNYMRAHANSLSAALELADDLILSDGLAHVLLGFLLDFRRHLRCAVCAVITNYSSVCACIHCEKAPCVHAHTQRPA
jgi:hypothetical protein